jgi:hypothetical protein
VAAQPHRWRLHARGKVCLSNAMLKAVFCLRTCIANLMAKESDIDGVIREVLEGPQSLFGLNKSKAVPDAR